MIFSVVIRSGDYYHFDGDPEDEEAEYETTTTTTTTSVTTPSSLSETLLPQVLPPPPAQPGSGAQMRSQESLQRHHLRAVWPSIDNAPLDALSNYTCPYSPTPVQLVEHFVKTFILIWKFFKPLFLPSL